MNLTNNYDALSLNLQTISHPLVADLYVKREYSREFPYDCKDVLVIEANFSDRKLNYETYSTMLSDLILALPDIRERVEDNVGLIDRIDIKTH